MIKNKFGFVAQSITSSDTLLSTNFKNIFTGLKMECKHNWIEVNWGAKYRVEGSYYYACTRCYQCRIVKLIQKEKALTL